MGDRRSIGSGVAGGEEHGLEVEPELASSVALAVEGALEFKNVVRAVSIAWWLTDKDAVRLRRVRVGIANVEH